MRPVSRIFGWAPVLLLGIGCEGKEPAAGPPEIPVTAPALEDRNGAIGIRRLTRFEFGNTVADLLGVRGSERDLSSDDYVGFLSNNQHVMRVGYSDMEGYERASFRISTAALPNLVLPEGCALDAMTGDCAPRFLSEFLVRAFRRPPTQGELQRYVALFNAVAADAGSREAVRGTLQAVLLSPSFLYRRELGADDQGASGKSPDFIVGREVVAAGRLSSWEIASRLSYFLWGSMPDAELFQAARANALRTPEQLKAQVTRMLADSRAERGLRNVLWDWLGLYDADLAKKGSDVLLTVNAAGAQTALEEATRQYISETLIKQGGSFGALYTSQKTFINDTTAPLYNAVTNGTNLRPYTTDPTERRGLFTQPLMLAAHTKESGYSVVQMGRFVRERLLCQHIPPPPPGVVTEIPETENDANKTYRQKFEHHASEPACRACHTVLDPPGYAFLSFDPVGRIKRNDPNGIPFDTTGELVNVDGGSVAFTDALTMVDAIAASVEAKACFARKFIEYAFGRSLAPADVPLYERAVRHLHAGSDFHTFLTVVVSGPEFLLRGPDETK